MADQSKVGTDWSGDELDLIVAEYFALLKAQFVGEPVVKAHRARALDDRIGRGHKSIEFKHMNISAVLTELGLPYVRGYRPMTNYQQAIFPAVDRYLDAHPDAWAIGEHASLLPRQARGEPRAGGGAETPPSSPGMAARGRAFVDAPPPPTMQTIEGPAEIRPLIVEDAPPPGAPRKPRPEGLERLVRKYNPAARDHRNRLLGRLGEEHVYRHEIDRLAAAGRMDLAKKVEWTSQERGDGAGYDIKSYSAQGDERLIEVKSTRGARSTPFFITRTEHEISRERPDCWRLHRVYDLALDPRLFRLKPPLEMAVTLEPETWRASVG